MLYLVRHGRTPLNADGVLRGRLDPPLDEVGRTEATALAEVLGTVALAAVVSSPLQRAWETALPVAKAVGASLIGDESLLDRDYGPWDGQQQGDVVARFGSLDDAPGIEPMEAFSARVTNAIIGIAARFAPRPVAVVAHDAVNRYVLAALVPTLGEPGGIPQRTGCWNRLEHDGHSWSAPIVDAVPDDGRRP